MTSKASILRACYVVALVCSASLFVTSGSAATGRSLGNPLVSEDSDTGANRERILFLRGGFSRDPVLWKMASDGTRRRQISKRPVLGSCPAASPNGRWILFTGEDGEEAGVDVMKMRPDGSRIRTVAGEHGDKAVGDWSPGGRRVVYSAFAGRYLTVVRANGRSSRRLPGMEGYNYGASWSPDGARLVFHHAEENRPSTFDIYTTTVRGGKIKQLTHTLKRGLDSFGPEWSPNGRLIAYSGNRDGDSEIFVMRADGSHKRQVTHNTVSDGGPSWSPDGRTIVFTRTFRNDNSDIFTVNVNGENERRVLRTPYVEYCPDWFTIP